MMLFAVIDKLAILNTSDFRFFNTGQGTGGHAVSLYKCFVFLYGVHHTLFYGILFLYYFTCPPVL